MNIFNKVQRRVLSVFAAASVFGTLLAGCSSPFENIAPVDPISVSGFKLNTYVEIKGYDRNCTTELLQNALAICDKYEQMFSRTLETSTLSQLNRHEITTVPSELGELIQYCITYGALSDGGFDISIGSLSSLWDFTSASPKVPPADYIDIAVKKINYRDIFLEKNSDGTYNVTIPENMILDVGAIAKGYIADKIKEYLLENNVKSALINLGGNVLCVGSKPDNSPYNVRVRKPFGESSEYLCRLAASDISIVTSGIYERCFTYDGRFYHHILNPRTGYPYDNDLTQVTIISKDSVTGDCLSTVCFTLGLKKGLSLIEATDGVEAIFVTSDNEMHYSSGAKKYII